MQQRSPLRGDQPTLRNARTFTQNDNRESADSSETDVSDNDEYDNDVIDSGEEDDSRCSSIQMRKMPMKAKCYTFRETYY